MKKSGVYTRTGDQGTTSLVGGSRVAKDDVRLEAYGTVDELNSLLGLLLTRVEEPCDHATLLRVQNLLFSVGSNLATDTATTSLRSVSVLANEDIALLENEIDRIDALLPPLHAFVLPGGCEAAALCHVCRTVCRRMERRILTLRSQVPVDENLLAFVNRLSDYLFVLARYQNIKRDVSEECWER